MRATTTVSSHSFSRLKTRQSYRLFVCRAFPICPDWCVSIPSFLSESLVALLLFSRTQIAILLLLFSDFFIKNVIISPSLFYIEAIQRTVALVFLRKGEEGGGLIVFPAYICFISHDSHNSRHDDDVGKRDPSGASGPPEVFVTVDVQFYPRKCQ